MRGNPRPPALPVLQSQSRGQQTSPVQLSEKPGRRRQSRPCPATSPRGPSTSNSTGWTWTWRATATTCPSPSRRPPALSGRFCWRMRAGPRLAEVCGSRHPCYQSSPHRFCYPILPVLSLSAKKKRTIAATPPAEEDQRGDPSGSWRLQKDGKTKGPAFLAQECQCGK